jgi:hypothetical protein
MNDFSEKLARAIPDVPLHAQPDAIQAILTAFRELPAMQKKELGPMFDIPPSEEDSVQDWGRRRFTYGERAGGNAKIDQILAELGGDVEQHRMAEND